MPDSSHTRAGKRSPIRQFEGRLGLKGILHLCRLRSAERLRPAMYASFQIDAHPFGLSAIFIALILRRVIPRQAIVRVDKRVFFPAVIVRPSEGQGLDEPGRCQGGEGTECFHEDCALQLWVSGFAGGVSKWIVEKGSARRLDRPGDVVGAAHAQRGQAGGFDVTGNQPHGLMTDRSDRNEQHRIDGLRLQVITQLGRQLLPHAPRRVDPAHAGEGMLG